MTDENMADETALMRISFHGDAVIIARKRTFVSHSRTSSVTNLLRQRRGIWGQLK